MSARERFAACAGGLLLVVMFVACAKREPRPGAATSSEVKSGDCEGCHREIALEWRSSFHRAAFSDRTFQRSLRLEETKEHAFCTRCHAPEGDAERGVGCTSCHGGDHASPVAAHASPSAPHRVTVDASLSSPSACATCHQFTFDPRHDGRADLVQKTLDEHASSELAGVSCVECHMPSRDLPSGRSHRDHSFVAGHSPSWIGRSVHVVVERAGPDRVRVDIRSDAGHAFPTGDMFRRVKLLLFGDDEQGTIVASSERTFGRTWGHVESGPFTNLRRELSDTRIRGRFTEEVTLDRGLAGKPPSDRGASSPVAIARVRWVLVFERVLSMRGTDDVTLESSDVIAEGTAN